MKNKIVLVLPLVLVLGVFALPVAAATPTDKVTKVEDLTTIINTIVDWAFTILIAIAALMIIYAGIIWTTAAGDEEKLGTARKTLIYALVGVAVALLAKGLVAIVQTLVSS